MERVQIPKENIPSPLASPPSSPRENLDGYQDEEEENEEDQVIHEKHKNIEEEGVIEVSEN